MVIKLLLLLFCFVVNRGTPFNCNLKFKFARVCHFYRYDERCFTGQIEFCQVLVTKRDELKCPYFVCTQSNSTFEQNSIFLGTNSSISTKVLDFEKEPKSSVNLQKSETIQTSFVHSKNSDNKSQNKTYPLQHPINNSSVNVEKQKLPTSSDNKLNKKQSVFPRHTNSSKLFKKEQVIKLNTTLEKRNNNKIRLLNSTVKNDSISANLKLPKINISKVNDPKTNLSWTKNENVKLVNGSKNSTFIPKFRSYLAKKTNESENNTFTNAISKTKLISTSKNVSFLSLKDENSKLAKLVTDDEANWLEVTKVLNFTKFQSSLRQKVKDKLSKTLRSAVNSTRKVSTQKMEVDCATKVCALEFREQPIVR